jgi:hypothetical protein
VKTLPPYHILKRLGTVLSLEELMAIRASILIANREWTETDTQAFGTLSQEVTAKFHNEIRGE